jgi:hypothetical protein
MRVFGPSSWLWSLALFCRARNGELLGEEMGFAARVERSEVKKLAESFLLCGQGLAAP